MRFDIGNELEWITVENLLRQVLSPQLFIPIVIGYSIHLLKLNPTKELSLYTLPKEQARSRVRASLISSKYS